MSNWNPNKAYGDEPNQIKTHLYEYGSDFPPVGDPYVFLSHTGVIHKPNNRTAAWHKHKRTACSIDGQVDLAKVRFENIRPCKDCWQ